jgi:hypothetical protein
MIVPITEIMLTPWGTVIRARDRMGSQIHHGSNANRKAVSRSAYAYLLLEFATQIPRLGPRLVFKCGKPGFLRSKKCAQMKFLKTFYIC